MYSLISNYFHIVIIYFLCSGHHCLILYIYLFPVLLAIFVHLFCYMFAILYIYLFPIFIICLSLLDCKLPETFSVFKSLILGMVGFKYL